MKTFRKLQRIGAAAKMLLDEGTLESEAGVSKLHRFVHFWLLVWKSFSRNRCAVRASALAYGTLLALIPTLAVVMSITSSFLKTEGEQQIDRFIIKLVANVTPRSMLSTNVPGALAGMASQRTNAAAAASAPPGISNTKAGEVKETAVGRSGETRHGNLLPSFAQQEEAVKARREIARRIHEFIQNTRSGALGITGSVALIFAALSLLGQIESVFNDIWGVAQGRGWFMRIVLYWGVISLAPLLLIVVLGLASGPYLSGTHQLLTTMPFIGSVIFQVLPVLLLCFAFAVFYALIPNTKVHWGASLVGGLVGGILWYFNNLVSVLYVSRVVSSSKIYGSLGLVPVFMIGLYLSWWILLFGAQVAYAFQNRVAYMEERQVETFDERTRESIALLLMAQIGDCFQRGKPPPTVVEMSRHIGLPSRLIQQLMQTLCAARLAVKVTGPDPTYMPARPLDDITCHDVLLALRTGHGQGAITRDELARSTVSREFSRIEEAERQAAASVTIRAMVEGAQTEALEGGPKLGIGQPMPKWTPQRNDEHRSDPLATSR